MGSLYGRRFALPRGLRYARGLRKRRKLGLRVRFAAGLNDAGGHDHGTGEDRDLLAWLSALERSVREDAPTFSDQSRNWLKALRERQDDTVVDSMGSPPSPHIFPN